MINYDFLVLSPSEFENISRDLLQKKEGISFESFTTGKDGGIDFRYSTDNGKKTIVQSKRYKDYASLLSHLQHELSKVVGLNPSRYILTTSVGLTPKNKTAIKKLFHPFIRRTSDIVGKDDLNNLLGEHGEIEHKHYKLWLSSTNVLEKILHSKIVNQSSFELEEARDQLKSYVQNDSVPKALSILQEHRYIIISGIPGIGKTTLARVLILHLLNSGFQEFVYLTDSIDEGYELFKEKVKQVFFFDDFLGQVRFEAKNSVNADSKIVKFIEKIKKTTDKVLIFATREYILSQARSVYETFRTNNIEIAKCILDLGSYTRLIKAQVIYNHLFFANVPQLHLASLVENRNYLRLVNHKNYSPRIIETIIKRRIWEDCTPEQFPILFKSYFDNPESVWLHAFENSPSKLHQYLLLVLLTIGTPVLLSDLEAGLKELLTKNGAKYVVAFDSITFKQAIKQLENTFIRTQKDSYDKIAVEFQNPSIQDFLINYLRDKADFISDLIDSSIFYSQFLKVFSASSNNSYPTVQRIQITSDQIQNLVGRIVEIFEKIESSRTFLFKEAKSDKTYWHYSFESHYTFLNNLNIEFGNVNKDARQFVYNKFQELILIEDDSSEAQVNYVQLLKTLDLSRIEFEERELLDKFVENFTWISNVEAFEKLEEIFPDAYRQSIATPYFAEKLDKVIQNETRYKEDSDMSDLLEKIKTIGTKYGTSFADEVKQLELKIAEHDEYVDSQVANFIKSGGEFDEPGDQLTTEDENEIITQLFNSLLESPKQ